MINYKKIKKTNFPTLNKVFKMVTDVYKILLFIYRFLHLTLKISYH